MIADQLADLLTTGILWGMGIAGAASLLGLGVAGAIDLLKLFGGVR